MPARGILGTVLRAAVSRLDAKALLLFCLVLLFYGVSVNSGDLYDYNLQQMGVEAIVERHVLYVDGSDSPYLRPRGDVFEYGGHLYAAKQPGQFLLGSLAYWPLYLLGIRYTSDYFLASGLVTLLTGGLATAVLVALVYDLAGRLHLSPRRALFVALVFGLGTIAYPYAGVAHHDAIASAFLFAGFYCAFRARHGRRQEAALWAMMSGASQGLALDVSLLPAVAVVTVVVYLVTGVPRRLLPLFLGAGLVALLPYFAYNVLAFGSPFVPGYVVGDFRDTFPQLRSPGWTVERLAFYFVRPGTGLLFYSPLVLLGLVGVWGFSGDQRAERRLILSVAALHLAYLLSIESHGDCQFGPRYLLPLMPFLSLALVPLLGTGAEGCGQRRLVAVGRCLVYLLAPVSIAIAASGAIVGTMYCEIEEYAVPAYLRQIAANDLPGFPLAAVALPLLVWVISYGFLQGQIRRLGLRVVARPAGTRAGSRLDWMARGMAALLAAALAATASTAYSWRGRWPQSATLDQAAIEHRLEATFGNSMRLLGFSRPKDPVRLGSEYPVTLFWQAVAETDADYTLSARLVNRLDEVCAQHDSRPARGRAPTFQWQRGHYITDVHPLDIPDSCRPGVYRLELVVYDFSTMKRLQQSGTIPPSDTLVLEQVVIAGPALRPDALPNPGTVGFAEGIELRGHEVRRDGASVSVTLYWQARTPVERDYTVFVHWFCQGGLLAQDDGAPAYGTYPTSAWPPGYVIADEHLLKVPLAEARGGCELRVGLYYLPTMERLPVVSGGVGAADYVRLQPP